MYSTCFISLSTGPPFLSFNVTVFFSFCGSIDGRCQKACSHVWGKMEEEKWAEHRSDVDPNTPGSPCSIKLFKGIKVKVSMTLVQQLFWKKGKYKWNSFAFLFW